MPRIQQKNLFFAGFATPCKKSNLGKIQSFYYDPDWQSCFAFKYSGCLANDNKFDSRAECETQCVASDGSVCRGPNGLAVPIKFGDTCEKTVCPNEYSCFEGMTGKPECCHTADQSWLVCLLF